jgi:conjugative relaxase-like TrwC/TraI family protein
MARRAITAPRPSSTSTLVCEAAMLSVATVRSAGGASNYFAADNYYTKGDADRSGEWFGEGAAKLGLEGQVEAKTFEALLKGELPDGTRAGKAVANHRAGIDLTFSLPKSWSLIALVGGDTRIVEAYREAVKDTLGWAERHLAETRMEVKGRIQPVATGNLTIALFRHDTNRNKEPNVHFHAVIANATQGPDGIWRTLHNDKLWAANTLLNAMTMARFRESVERLGYEAGTVLRHGNFEAAEVAREDVMAFSTRRQEVLDKLSGMDTRGPGARDAATLMTRAAKPRIADRAALSQDWQELAVERGMDLAGLVAQAQDRADRQAQRGASGPWRSLAERGRAWLAEFAARIAGRPDDQLLPVRLGSLAKDEVAAAQAVASAVRHLSEREAAFPLIDVYKVALEFGLPTTMPRIEAQVARLLRSGLLLRGKDRERNVVTTRDALASEQRIVAEAHKGRGAVSSILDPDTAGERLQALSELKYGLRLNSGQEAAGRLLLGSSNRIVAIQGVAGAGKSTMLRPAADILREDGRKVVGLAVQNTLVQMLARETGVASMTVARFLKSHRDLLAEGPDPAALASARAEWRGAVVLLDEASMVGNADKEKLVRLANLLELGRFAMIGDRKQLGAVDAGKPFEVLQRSGVEAAAMRLNIRARDRLLREAQAAAQGGDVGQALRILEPHTVEARDDAAIVAAETWLALSPQERDRTAIYASGRRLRGDVNQAAQAGLKANGELGGEALKLTTLVRVNTTREELRFASAYAPGLVVELDRERRAQKLEPGRYTVAQVDAAKGMVTLLDREGRERPFVPGRLRPNDERETLRLFERRELAIHAGDRIRWTDSDHRRGLYNADQARIAGIDKQTVALRTSAGVEHRLRHDDPMLERLDLAYALNAHMAQGLTSDRGIAVMDSRERNLASQKTFLVTITRLRDGLTLVVDSADRFERAVERNPGEKTSALDTVARLGRAAARGLESGREPEPAKEPQALERQPAKIKPFEIGL